MRARENLTVIDPALLFLRLRCYFLCYFLLYVDLARVIVYACLAPALCKCTQLLWELRRRCETEEDKEGEES